MTKLLNIPVGNLEHGYGNEWWFASDIHPDWTILEADTGATVEVNDAVGGGLVLTTGATDNNEAYIWTSVEGWKFAADKPLIARARLQYAEANTDDANVMFGLMDGVAANALQDNGAGPKASYSGAVFFKADGDTVWSVENSIATTQKTTQLTADNSLTGTAQTAGGSDFVTLEIISDPRSATENEISFKIDGKLVARHTNQTTASATDMSVVFGVKAGSANSEVVTAQIARAFQAY